MRTWVFRVFNVSLWLATALLAGFLIAFATRSLMSLEGLSAPMSLAQHVDHGALDRAETALAGAALEKSELTLRRKVALADLEQAWTAVRREESALSEWAATQNLGAQGRRHPDFVKRDKSINGLRAAETSARAALDALDAKLLKLEQDTVQYRRAAATETELAEQRFAAALHQRKLGLLAEQIALGMIAVLALCLAAAGTIGWRMAHQNVALREAEQRRLQAQQQAEAERLALVQAEQRVLEEEAALAPQYLLPLDVEFDPEVGLFPEPPAQAAKETKRRWGWLSRAVGGFDWRRRAPIG